MRVHTVIAALVGAGLAAYLLGRPVTIDPVAWQPGPNPGLTGPFAESQALSGLRRLVPELGEAPEAVAHGPGGFLYTGLHDGRIVRFRPDGEGGAELVAQTGGRPLGLRFDGPGHLVVADALRGLLAVAPDRTVTVLTDSVDGARLRFPNALDIATDGPVWFTDASRRVDQHH